MPYTRFTTRTNGVDKNNASDVNVLNVGLANATVGVYNVLENGAKGDGTTDDATNLAVTDSANGGDGVTHFPATTGGYLIGTSVTLTHATSLPPGAKFKPASGKTLTLNGHLDAGAYQVFDLSAGGAVALGAGAARRIYPEWAGAKADNATDNATPFARWKALVPARGGRGELQQGIYKTSGTLLLPSYTSTDGVPGGLHPDGTGDPLSGSCVLYTGATGGTILSLFGTSLASVRGINLNGGGISGVTGFLIDSANAPSSKNPSLEDFFINACGVALTDGYGVRVGTSIANAYQADTWRLRRGLIWNCDTGLSIYSVNAGFQGIVEQVGFVGHRKGVEIAASGNFKIDSCAFGGHTSSLIADIWIGQVGGLGGGFDALLVLGCQTEKQVGGAGYFLLVDSTAISTTATPITLIENVINNVGVKINASVRVLGIGNRYQDCNFVLGANAPQVADYGSGFTGTNVRSTSGTASWTSGSTTLTDTAGVFVAGVDEGKRLVPVGSGPVAPIHLTGFASNPTIVSVTDSTHVVLSVTPTSSQSAQSVQYDYGYVILPGCTGTITYYGSGGITAAGGQLALTSTGLTIQGHLSSQKGLQGLPTAAAGSGAGTSPPTPTLGSASTDTAGDINFGTGTGPSAGQLLTVTFATPYGLAPHVFLESKNQSTAGLQLAVQSATTTGFQIFANVAPAASQATGAYAVQWFAIGQGAS